MAMNGDMGDQVAPVQHVDKPACGIRAHGHPAQDYVGCPSALMYTLNADGGQPHIAQALGDEWFSRNLAERSAVHRAMCEPRFTNLRDVDSAFEFESGVKARQAAYANKPGFTLSPTPGRAA